MTQELNQSPIFSEKTMQLFEEACTGLGYNSKEILPDVSKYPQHHAKSLLAYAMIIPIIENANKQNSNWLPDYNKPNNKYYALHWVKADKKRSSGFGFSYSRCVYDLTCASVGFRLCFGSVEDESKYREPLEELYLAYKL